MIRTCRALLIVFCALLTSCNPIIDTTMNREYKLTVDRVVHDLYIEWPLDEKIPAKSERDKMSIVLNILKKAHDVEVILLPVFDVSLKNKFVHDRVHIIREKLMDMGVGADKIAIAKSSKVPEGRKAGINIVITEFQMHIPKCQDWDIPVGDFDTNKRMPNFGCSSVNYMGKMIANPASVIKYRKTDVDTTLAISAVETYAQVEELDALSRGGNGAVNSNGMNISGGINSGQSRISDSMGRMGRASAGVANTIGGAL